MAANVATREAAEAVTDDEDSTPALPPSAAADSTRDAYASRVSRAKGSEPMPIKLDLGGLSLGKSELPKGDHQLTHRDDTMLATPRAKNEQTVLTVRGAPKHSTAPLMHLTPAELGNGDVKFGWQLGGKRLVTCSVVNGHACVQLWSRKGVRLAANDLCASAPKWLGFDSSGECVAVLTEKHGVFLWEVGDLDSPPEPLSLAPEHTTRATFCSWSKMCPQLAIGTADGKVVLYNRTEALLQLHERKGAMREPVTCGDWMSDNRLGLASGQRVKISQPIAELGAKWESFSKFRLGGYGSKVPKHMRDAGAPTMLAFTHSSYPPFVAVSLGSKYLLTFDTTRVHEDLGLTFPEDYGGIVGFHWLPSNLLLVSLSNGYVVTVDFAALIKLQAGGQLPARVAAMATSRLFEEYCTAIDSTADQKVAICGDTLVKVVKATGVDLEVYVEVQLDRKPTVAQCLNSVLWDKEGLALACSSTDGHLYAHTVF